MLNFQTSVGVLRLMAKQAIVDSLASFGITDDLWKLTTGSAPWTGVDRPRVTRVLDALVYGSIDLAGLPRFRVPAEYIAAIMVTFVSANNLMLACAWRERTQDADALSNEGYASDSVTSHQLFSLCVRLCDESSPQVSAAQAEFEKKVGVAIEHARVQGVNP